MDNFDESKIEFEPDTLTEAVRTLARTVPAVMASACEGVCLCSHLLKVQQVRTTKNVQSDPLLRVDYEFWTTPDQFDAANPECVTYRREHLYVRASVLDSGELFVHGLGPEFGFEEWFNDNTIEGNSEEAGLPAEGYAALLQDVTENHLNAIAEYLVDDKERLPQGIRQPMQQLYIAAEKARRHTDKIWSEQESKREAECQLANPTWDPQSLHFVQHADELTLRLYSQEKQFIWTASVSLLSDSRSIRLSKGRKVSSPLNYVSVSKVTTDAPCPISPATAEAVMRELFMSGWLTQQMENLK